MLLIRTLQGKWREIKGFWVLSSGNVEASVLVSTTEAWGYLLFVL